MNSLNKILFLVFVSHLALSQMIAELPASIMPKVNNNFLNSKIDILSNGDTVLITKLKYDNGADYKEIIQKGTPLFNDGAFANEYIYLDGLPTKGTVQYNVLKNSVIFSAENDEALIEVKPDSFTCLGRKFINLKKAFGVKNSGYYERYFSDGINQLFKLNIVQIKENYNYKPQVIENGNYASYFVKDYKIFVLKGKKLIIFNRDK